MLSGGAAGYGAIHSRVRVMYAGLLTPQTEAGLRDSGDLAGLLALLKHTVYGPYLAGVDDKELTPRRTMNLIKNRIADVYLAIMHSSPVNTRSLVVQLFRHFEVDNLKAILRGIATGSSWEQVQGVLFPLGTLGLLPAQRMLETGSIETAIAELADTPYYEILTLAYKRYADEKSLFALEVALDLDYWHKLWSTAGQLPGRDRSQALRVVGLLLDLNNLMWAIRYRIYYHLSEEEIINYTLPFGYHVRDEDIRSIAAGAEIGRIVERIYPGLHNVDGLLENPERGLPKLELQLQRRLAQQLRGFFTSYPFHIGLPLAFALLNELEVQDLTVLVEAKASQMSANEFEPYLLMGADSGNGSGI